MTAFEEIQQAGPVAAVLHAGVGLGHSKEVLVDFGLQFLVIDGDLGH